jgi:hypothetical protein
MKPKRRPIEKSPAQDLELVAIGLAHVRLLLGDHGEQDDPIVEHLVVLEVVQQGRRRAVGRAGEEHAVPALATADVPRCRR